jgi:plasmid stabilization system protein ParE
VATVVVARQAIDDLTSLSRTHSLPRDTAERVRRSIAQLRDFPLLGAPLTGRWTGFRFLLGPWRWMLVVYRYDDETDTLVIVTIQDARSARAPTTSR